MTQRATLSAHIISPTMKMILAWTDGNMDLIKSPLQRLCIIITDQSKSNKSNLNLGALLYCNTTQRGHATHFMLLSVSLKYK